MTDFQNPETTGGMDMNQRHVRIREERADGFVEFEFSFSDPELFVEMILPRAEFDAFCAAQQATFLPPRGAVPEGGAEGEEAQWRWSLHDATHVRFRE